MHAYTPQLPFVRNGDGTVTVNLPSPRPAITEVVSFYRTVASTPGGPAYGVLYPAVSEDIFESIELGDDDARMAATVGAADTVLATVEADLLTDDQFDAWLRVFSSARKVYRHLSALDDALSFGTDLCDAVYVGILMSLPQPEL